MPDPPTAATIAEPLPVRLLQETASMFALLSAALRLRILWLLADGDSDAGTLAAATGESVATVSRHLGKLKLAGSVRARRDGRRRVYVVADPHVVDVIPLPSPMAQLLTVTALATRCLSRHSR